VAIELNDSILQTQEHVFTEGLRFLLTRTPETTVAVRLYRNAVKPETKALFFRVMRTVGPEDLKRVLVWFDARPVLDNHEDIELSRQDALVGRTPWSEGRAMTQEEIEAAAAGLITS